MLLIAAPNAVVMAVKYSGSTEMILPTVSLMPLSLGLFKTFLTASGKAPLFSILASKSFMRFLATLRL